MLCLVSDGFEIAVLAVLVGVSATASIFRLEVELPGAGIDTVFGRDLGAGPCSINRGLLGPILIT